MNSINQQTLHPVFLHPHESPHPRGFQCEALELIDHPVSPGLGFLRSKIQASRIDILPMRTCLPPGALDNSDAGRRAPFQTRGMLSSSIFGQPDSQPPLATQPQDNTNNDDDDGGAVGGNVLGEVTLARKPRTSFIHFFRSLVTGFFYFSIVPRFCDGSTRLPHNFRFYDSLDSFQAFYVNKYIDYHTHEIAF